MRHFCLLLLFAAPLSAQTQGWDLAWSFDGAEAGEGLGYSVDGGADVDRDGYDDLILGAPFAVNNGVLYSGAAYVRSGRDGTLLFEFRGNDPAGSSVGGQFGCSVAWVGDVNGDGFPDMAIGAKGKANPNADDGEVIVYSGADGSVIHDLPRANYVRSFGRQVGPAGDFDGDGVPDILVGAPGTYAGAFYAGAFLVFSGATGAELLRIDGVAQTGANFGWSVAHAGDIDQDGTPDYFIGASSYDDPNAGNFNNGRASLYSGATGTVLYEYTGAQRDRLGSAVAAGRDLDGDGIPDLVAGSPDHGSFGSAFAYSGADGSLLFQVDGEQWSSFANALCSPGDLNGDGFGDLVVGASDSSFSGPLSGSLYLYSGIDGSLIERVNGTTDNQRLGYSVAAAGDLTLSGSTELVAGGNGDSGSGLVSAGRVVALFDTSLPASADDDGDALPYFREITLGADPFDQDSDDDGLSDGEEHYGNGPNMLAPTDPVALDSDADGLQDGTELGLAGIVWTGNPPAIRGTDPAVFQPDLDPSSMTDPGDPDSDGGGIAEGGEDFDANGRVDLHETDPTDPADDRVPASLIADWPTVSAGISQVTALELDFGAGFAAHGYQILGSMAGSAPGFVYEGVSIPLVLDSFTMMLASGPPPLMLVNFGGALDSQGYALAYISTRPGEVAAFVGQTVWFAAVSIDPVSGLLSNATIALALDVVP